MGTAWKWEPPPKAATRTSDADSEISRPAIFGATLLILGFDVVFSSLFISAMSMKK